MSKFAHILALAILALTLFACDFKEKQKVAQKQISCIRSVECPNPDDLHVAILYKFTLEDSLSNFVQANLKNIVAGFILKDSTDFYKTEVFAEFGYRPQEDRFWLSYKYPLSFVYWNKKVKNEEPIEEATSKLLKISTIFLKDTTTNRTWEIQACN